MKTAFRIILGSWMMFCITSCRAEIVQSSNNPTETQIFSEIPLDEFLVNPSPGTASVILELTTAANPAVTGSEIDLDELSAAVGYEILQPVYLPDGYILEKASVDEPSQSICLQYRHMAAQDSILFIAQGPSSLAPPLEMVEGWPEYAFLREAVSIGGSQDSFHVSGWRRLAWACSQAAEAETTPYSYALAPRFTWEAQDQIYEIYSASGGCGTTGGVTILDLLRVAEGLTGVSTHPLDELDMECLHSATDAEELAGFDVKEPSYLPPDVAFYFASYDESTDPVVVLRFLHLKHSNMGSFFQIEQYTKAPSFYMESCEGLSDETCEVLQVGTLSVVYQFFDPTERLDWFEDGVYFSLFRNAGDPGKIYKDELLKVIESMR